MTTGESNITIKEKLSKGGFLKGLRLDATNHILTESVPLLESQIYLSFRKEPAYGGELSNAFQAF